MKVSPFFICSIPDKLVLSYILTTLSYEPRAASFAKRGRRGILAVQGPHTILSLFGEFLISITFDQAFVFCCVEIGPDLIKNILQFVG